MVTKRDGTVEHFRPAKLTNCLVRAMQGRAYDPNLAEPLTRAVTLHLGEWRDTQPPTTNYIHRCVCSVLRQTGLGDVAEDLGLQRRTRTLRRRQIRVVDEDGSEHGVAWRKASIVATLLNDYGLRHTVSRFLAGEIEMQVFALDYRRIRKSFLAELVRNEVLAWGLADTQVLEMDTPVVEPPVASRPPESEE